MKIVVLVKQVPSGAARPRIAEARDRIREDGLSFKVNEADLYAIEEAVHQRTEHGGSVVAVTVGPPRAKEALQVAYARGADRAIHLVDETFRGALAGCTVRLVKEVLAAVEYDMVFTGIQAEDDLAGHVGPALAEALGIPAVTGVMAVQADPRNRRAMVTRELGDGLKQQLEVRLPCLLTIQLGIRPLPFLPVLALVRAKSRPIDTVTIASLKIPTE